jgi:hypothetical protein
MASERATCGDTLAKFPCKDGLVIIVDEPRKMILL